MDIVAITVTGHDDEKAVMALFVVDERSFLNIRISDFPSTLPIQPVFKLQSRIVNCYFENQVLHENATFQDRSTMREAINHAAEHVIVCCAGDPCSKALDIVVDVTEDGQTPSATSLLYTKRISLACNLSTTS